jgi:uncharacterized membrane protein YkoI
MCSAQNFKKVAISKEKAIAIAKAEVGKDSVVKEIELDDDDSRYHYEIELKNGNTEYDIEVDAYTGEIISISTDFDDDDENFDD